MSHSLERFKGKAKLLRIMPSSIANGPILFPCNCQECKLHYVSYEGMHSTLKKSEQKAIWRDQEVAVIGVSPTCGPCRNEGHKR